MGVRGSGEPLDFEQTDRYTARRKRDRFTPGMLGEYLRALGVPCDAEPTWSDALILERIGL